MLTSVIAGYDPNDSTRSMSRCHYHELLSGARDGAEPVQMRAQALEQRRKRSTGAIKGLRVGVPKEFSRLVLIRSCRQCSIV